MTTLPARHVADGAENNNMRRLHAFAELGLNVWERWMALNLDAARTGYTSASVTARSLVDELIRAEAAAYEEGVDRVAEYVRNVNHLCLNTQATVAQMNADTMMESTGSVPAFMQQVQSGGPHASALHAIALLQAAVSNSSAIFGKMIEAGRDMADSNLAAVARAFRPALPAPARAAKPPRRAA